MEPDEKAVEIRRHILENAIHLHENVISTLRQEISDLNDIRPDYRRF